MSKNNTSTKITSIDQIFTSRKAKAQPIMTLDELAAYASKHGLTTKSACIRKLAAEGHSRAAIAVTLGCKYQQVRNTLVKE